MITNIETILKQAVGGCADTITTTAPRRVRFSYPVDKETAARLLSTAYRVEVEARGMELQQTPEVSQYIWAVAEYLTNPARKPSLLLYGGRPGTGKTTTVRAIIRMAKELRGSFAFAGIDRLQMQLQRCLTDTERREFERRETAVKVPTYYTALDIARLFQATDPQERQKDRAKYNGLADCYFLAVDDMGTEPTRVSDYGNEFLPLVELISRRYDKQLPTIITSNLGGDAIAERYGERIADRLREMCETIAYNSAESFRG